MSFTGVKNLDHSIDETNAWLAEIAAEFGTEDRQFPTGSRVPGCTHCGTGSAA